MAQFTTCGVGMLTWQDHFFLNEIRLSLREREGALNATIRTSGIGSFPDVQRGDTDIQYAIWIRAMQEWIDVNCESFIDDLHDYHANPESQPVYLTLQEARSRAGLHYDGWTRWYLDGAGVKTEGHGYIQRGDFIGHWIWDELQRMIDVLRWVAMPVGDPENYLYVVTVALYGSSGGEATAQEAYDAAIADYTVGGGLSPNSETMIFDSQTFADGATFSAQHHAYIQTFCVEFDPTALSDAVRNLPMKYCFTAISRAVSGLEYKDYFLSDNGEGAIVVYPDQESLFDFPGIGLTLTSGEYFEDHPDYTAPGWHPMPPYEATTYKDGALGGDGFRHATAYVGNESESFFFLKFEFSFTR